MKIIHCADIHLDSKMESNLPAKLANERRVELRDSFCHLVEYAKTADVSVVIIAGDMFDEDRCSSTTLQTVFGSISNAPDISFLYLQGNHGTAELLSSVDLPSNFFRFGSEWTTFEFENVSIQGVEITQDNYKTIYGSYIPNPNAVNIAVLHGDLAGSPGPNCLASSLLERMPVDYFALGHRHSFSEWRSNSKGVLCYSGCLEGRGFDECGEKGFVELSISEDGAVKSRFIPSSKRVMHEVKVDISGLESHPEILNACKAAARNISSKDLVKFVLCGHVSADANRDLFALKQSLEKEFYFAKVVDSSTLSIDIERYEKAASLQGEFVRVVMSNGNLSDEDKQQIMTCGLRALAGEKAIL